MKHLSLKGASLLLLAMTLACQKPLALPTFDQDLNRAAGTSERQVAEAQRADYREGFLNGARMVEEAVKAGRKPFQLRLGQGPSAFLPTGPLPEGATILEDELPVVEMDPETGLQLRFVRADFTAAFARGQVDGFQWGLARHPADLIHPKAPPKVPELWQPWPTKGGSLALSGSALELDLIWVPGMLAWNIRERGFPGRRNWRPVPAWVRPIRVALGDDAFWVDTDKGALGLDLETGAIRRVAPVLAQREATTELPQEDGEATWQAYEQRWQAEEDAARPGRLEAAAKGNPEAMLALGWATNDATEAAGWFRKAAELGNAQGMFELAVRLYQGRSVSENREEAKAWFQKAAKAGHPSAAEVLKGLFDAP